MNKIHYFINFNLFSSIFFCLISTVYGQDLKYYNNLLTSKSYYLFSLNNLNIPLTNDGVIGGGSIPPYSGGSIGEELFLYSAGFFLSGYMNDDLWINGVASSSRVFDYVSGNINSQSDDPKFKFYVLESSDKNSFEKWVEWNDAVDQGAYFYDGDNDRIFSPIDKNQNGKWDFNEDKPDFLGDKYVWCVFNDGVQSNERMFTTVEPLGIEIRQSIWSYDLSNFEGIFFVRYSILNTGIKSNVLDSVYFSAWTDPDLGNYTNNLVGCDTLLNSGYTYESEQNTISNRLPKAFLIQLLQGPISYITGETYIDKNGNNIYDETIDISLDTAYNVKGNNIGLKTYPGSKNLNMTSFSNFQFPLPPDDQQILYNRKLMEGLFPIEPCNNYGYGEIRGDIDCSLINKKFLYSGDPISDFGWINTLPSDQKIILNTGPFQLKINEPIDIILAYIITGGSETIYSIEQAKSKAMLLQNSFKDFISESKDKKFGYTPIKFNLDQNYPNPFNSSTQINFSIPEKDFVTLKLYDVLGKEISTLVNEIKYDGNHSVVFNAKNLSSGLYIYTLTFRDQITSKKMILLK